MFLLAFTIKKDIPHWSTTISTFVLAFIGLWIGAGMFRMILRDGVVATFSGAHEFDKIDEMKTTIGKLY
jgi:Ni,Fe-hydrogenase I cytochrome b subunit